MNTNKLDALVIVPRTLTEYLNDIKNNTENKAVREPIVVHITATDYMRQPLLEFEIYSAFKSSIAQMIDGCDIAETIFELPMQVRRITVDDPVHLFEKKGWQNLSVFILQLSHSRALKPHKSLKLIYLQNSLHHNGCANEHEDRARASKWIPASHEALWNDQVRVLLGALRSLECLHVDSSCLHRSGDSDSFGHLQWSFDIRRDDNADGHEREPPRHSDGHPHVKLSGFVRDGPLVD